MTDAELQNYLNALRTELASLEEEKRRLTSLSGSLRREAEVRLPIRQAALEERFRRTIEAQENRRLDALRDGVRSDN